LDYSNGLDIYPGFFYAPASEPLVPIAVQNDSKISG
jgi:hypothetical protein